MRGAVVNDADHTLTRQMWHLLEPVHAVFYYAPDVFAVAEELGIPIATERGRYGA